MRGSGAGKRGETGHRPTGRLRTPAKLDIVLTAAVAMTVGSCAHAVRSPKRSRLRGRRRDRAATPARTAGRRGDAARQHHAARKTGAARRAGATAQTGDGVGALFAPFITPGAPGSFRPATSAARSRTGRAPGQADNAPSGPNLVYPPPSRTWSAASVPEPGSAPPSPPRVAEIGAPPAATPAPPTTIVQVPPLPPFRQRPARSRAPPSRRARRRRSPTSGTPSGPLRPGQTGRRHRLVARLPRPERHRHARAFPPRW
jgi:hypothetical protein